MAEAKGGEVGGRLASWTNGMIADRYDGRWSCWLMVMMADGHDG